MSLFRALFGGRKKETGPIRDVAALSAGFDRAALHVVKIGEPSTSHLGGDPRLPSGVSWPRRDGDPLRFLARLSLADLHAKEPVPWLPATGALLFFYDVDKQPWGFDPADRGGWSVLHVADEPPAAPAPARESDGLLACLPVTFNRIQVLPSPNRPEVEALNLSNRECDAYCELLDRPFRGLPRHQLSGFPSPVQDDSMELECQLASNGVYCGTPEGYASARARELKNGAANWRLLFQMDSDDDLGVMWGDAGLLYFWIEESAARQGDFSNVWLVLQCG